MPIPIENNSWDYVQRLIEREINSAFKSIQTKWNNMIHNMVNDPSNHLARLVYDKGLRAQIKEHYKAKYEQRINYLVGENNELMKELEQYEKVSMQERV